MLSVTRRFCRVLLLQQSADESIVPAATFGFLRCFRSLGSEAIVTEPAKTARRKNASHQQQDY